MWISHRLARATDITDVLRLQRANLWGELTPEQRERGFVTTPFTISQLEEIIDQDGLYVSITEDSLIAGYLFAGTWEYFSQWPIFPFMANRFPQLEFLGGTITTSNSFQYGPVCVDTKYRGTGVFAQLYECMRLDLVKRYPISYTFINAANKISERAHHRIGWKTLDHFTFNDKEYLGLAFDMHVTALDR